ncbi:acyl-CoA dehydrogenase family protein [Oricola cellulosilytica]|uniref:Pimeloyl-CoA dehydrogenase large subunit n=1 Tax=Oricola cellulosilytica TaxID=1429082 RepID=A0A4V2MNN6_9HYPH|nr:acyl-CoA dehydrogenase family protein [Oricola cellulosilytica]TCD13736.1 pimeloyl-CoA dehydrogenase large subunit [Oricola cellulosilytica]
MDISYSAEDLAFREKVRAFLQERLPRTLSEKVRRNQHLSRDDMEQWHGILNDKGWLAQDWPKEHGGAGWTTVQQQIFEDEAAAANAPRIVPFGLKMLAPVLMKFGSPEQKDRYLPRILNGSDWWCQGYSEPGAGSDLASLKTRAVRDGDHYVVNGQKTWTTLGQHANKIFCLVRTSTEGKPQEGISFLLIDMDTPGITIRPIILLEGTHEVNEVFFDDVRVPIENLVGEENKGWTYAKYLLTHERTNIAGVGFSRAALAHVKAIARDQKVRGRPLINDPLFAARIAKVEMELAALATTNLRVLSAPDAAANAGPISSMLKIKGTEIRQELNDLARRALGPYALPFVSEALEPGWNGEPIGPEDAAGVAADYFNNRKISIYGGSNEVQRNIISKMVMGL